MEFKDKLLGLVSKIDRVKDSLETEEATKNALVMPFIHTVLGYDIFNPDEVIPEFTADTGTKKGEKVDYAIRHSGEMQILVEAKKYGEKLTLKHASQLFRYFSVTSARIALLTNGTSYLGAERITMRDTKSYCGVLVDDNNRKPLCRLHFNRAQKYIGLFDEEKNETRHPIESLDDIFKFEDVLVSTASTY